MDAARSRPEAACWEEGGEGGRAYGAAPPRQRPHGVRSRPNAYTAVAPRPSVRHRVRPRRVASAGARPWAWPGIKGVGGGVGAVTLFPRASEDARGVGSSTAEEAEAAPQAIGVCGYMVVPHREQ